MEVKENFTKSDIKEQLRRILSTPAFKNSGILSGFLTFVIDETLAGRELELKEYTIGIFPSIPCICHLPVSVSTTFLKQGYGE